MKIDDTLLTNIAARATQNSSRALSTLVGQAVEISTTQANYLPLEELTDLVTSKQGMHIVAFSQLISGVKGVALLVMEHNDALHLVDSLMKRRLGTTRVLTDIDKSAIKETLNILSNSQLTALGEDLGVSVNVMPPALITRERIVDVIDHLAAHRSEQGEETDIIVFETSLVVTGQACQVTMFIVFDSKLAAMIEDEEGSGEDTHS